MLQNRYIDIHGATVKELRAYISNEGKRLNQQLVEIQKRGLQESSFGYDNLTKRSINHPFLGVSKSGMLKVNLSTRGLGRGELQELAGVIKRTVSYQTITITGIKQYYGRVFETLRNKPGYENLKRFTDTQLADILKTTGWESAKTTLGSEQAFRMIGSVKSANQAIKWLERSGGGQSIDSYVKEFNKFTGAGYQWEPATNTPFGPSQP